jgi:hypothetical protein
MKNINRNVTDNEETIVKSGGHINEFLWLCAGVNRRVLRQCPTDYAKYAGIGGTILFTALMAILSGGYAFYTIFNNQLTAVFFGIFWGLLIFNLDRFMVNTMYSDGTHKITKDELKGGIPRIILAIFLGIVISTPIEMRIFKDKIQTQLMIEQGKTEKKIDAEYRDLTREINELSREKNHNDSLLRVKQDQLVAISDSLQAEYNGRRTSGQRGNGIIYKELEKKKKELERQVGNLEKETKQKNDAIDIRLNPKIKEQNNYEKQKHKALQSERGFTAELRALYELTSPKESLILFISRMMIMLLFITIEVIPTFFKMMIASGPYDDLLRAEMHKARVLADKRISDLNDEINTQVQISTAKNKERLETEVTANKELMKKLAKTQAELLQNAIDKWKEDEMAKIAQDPSLYIKGNHQLDDN